MGNDGYHYAWKRWRSSDQIAFGLLAFLAVAYLAPVRSFLVPISPRRQCTYLEASKQDEIASTTTEALVSASSSTPVCRIVSRADSKLPTSSSTLPKTLIEEPHLMEKLDSYYNAQAYKRTKTLAYLEKTKKTEETFDEDEEEYDDDNDDGNYDREEIEKELVSVVRNSLEDAGFQLLSRRDLDLCDSLNVGYLLRLSISPALSELDPRIAKEFFPDRVDKLTLQDDELLFGGRCLVFWRGYSKEVTTGRLIIPKIDYLQTSVVRRSAAWVKRRLDTVEAKLSNKADRQTQKLQSKLQDLKENIIPEALLSKFHGEGDGEEYEGELEDEDSKGRMGSSSSFRDGVNLGRYGGPRLRFVATPDPDDALDPFMVCEVEEYDSTNGSMNIATFANDTTIVGTADVVEHDLYEKLNHQGYLCEYDERMAIPNGPQNSFGRIHLLERVSINNLVNIFTKNGRKSLLQTFFTKSKLVEPTYEEVRTVSCFAILREGAAHSICSFTAGCGCLEANDETG